MDYFLKSADYYFEKNVFRELFQPSEVLAAMKGGSGGTFCLCAPSCRADKEIALEARRLQFGNMWQKLPTFS